MRLGFPHASARPPRTVVRSLILATALLTSAPWLCASPATAAAATPNWRLTAKAVPSDLPPGGQGQFQLEVENIGDAPTSGEPITVVDHLPAGVRALRAGAVKNGEDTLEIPGPWGECAGAGTETVTCTYEGGAIAPVSFDSAGTWVVGPAEIGIEVEAEPRLAGATLASVATVSGGGAPSTATGTLETTISGSPPPFAAENVHELFTNADGTPDTQAGSHPYEMVTSMTFPIDGEGDATGAVRDVHVDLPAGFVGNPNATPKCTRVRFDVRLDGSLNPDCPPDSQIGIAIVYLEPNQPTPIPVYNIVPPGGVPAQFAFAAGDRSGFLNAGVRTGSDYGLSLDMRDLPQIGPVGVVLSLWGNPSDASHDLERFAEQHSAPAGQEGISIPFAAQPRPFLSLPGACGAPQVFGISVDSWEHPVEQAADGEYGTPTLFDATDELEHPAVLEGCGLLPFQPSIAIKPESHITDSPTGLTATVALPQPESPSGVAEADVKDATVTFPAGLTVNPSAADGLGACSEAQIGFEATGGKNGNGFEEFNPEREPGVKTPLFTRSPAQASGQEEEEAQAGVPGEPARCPNAAKLGTVEVSTPLIHHPLLGALYLARQSENPFGSLLAVYVTVDDPITGIVVKLPGEVSLNPVTGQISAIVNQDPQLPFSNLKIVLFGGEKRARLTTPPTCGLFTATAQLSPWSGTRTVAPYDQFETTEAPGGGSCPTSISQEPNHPAFAAGVFSPIAGSYSPFALELSREDGSQGLGSLSVTLPPGLLGRLAGVEECPQTGIETAEHRNGLGQGRLEAEHPSCPSGSELGVVHIGAGSGAPLYVTGHAYLAGSYEGAPFSIVVITPALIGSPTHPTFDLGTVVVRAGIYIDPSTAQVTVESDSFPSILDGIPLDLRSITVEITRPDFMLNPTSCAKTSVAGTVLSTQGASVGVSSPFQVGGCDNLPFKPTITALTRANGEFQGHGASLHVVITAPTAQANIRSLKLDLPRRLPARLEAIQKACPEATFDANPAACPKVSVIGSASVQTPILAGTMAGPAYLVSKSGTSAAHPGESKTEREEAAFPDLVLVLQGEGVRIDLTGGLFVSAKNITSVTFRSIPDVPIRRLDLVLPEGKASILAASAGLCTKKPLRMTTAITAQNGARAKRTVKVAVAGCRHKKSKRTKKTRRVARRKPPKKRPAARR